MNVWRLVVREILYRKLNFALGLLSVVVAVGCVVAQMTLLHRHDIRTDHIIATKEAETKEEMGRLEDDYRKITKKMGFNLLILPKAQSLGDFYADDYAKQDMPEEYVKTLASSKAVTIRHLLPSIQKKLKWPEQQRTVVLIGTRGEVPFAHRDPKKPILFPVKPGTLVLGHELHRGIGLAVGDKVKLLGRDFTVAKCHSERGNKDDITIWTDLAEAQEILDKRGKINAILALKCHCAGIGLAQIRAEIASILPNTQIVEFQTKAVARAEARGRAALAAERAIQAERENRAKLRCEREAFAALLVPLVLVASIVWIGCLTFANVRDRRAEIGILRAVGAGSWSICAVFLGKAAATGILGAALGYAVGFVAGSWQGADLSSAQLFNPHLLVLMLLCAPLLSCMAALMPALTAVQQDPAVVLQEQ